jgi:hypothetical protein
MNARAKNLMPKVAGLPLVCNIRFVHRVTWLIAALLVVSSTAGRWFGPRGWYDPQSITFSALLVQDALALLFALPLLLLSAWLAHRGSLRGLLVWMGTLFYIAYSYYFYVIGIRLSPLFPIHIILVSLSMYALLALWFALDLDRVKARFKSNTPVRLIGGFLMALALAFAGLWAALTMTQLAAGSDMDPVSRYVIAIDAVVLLPLSFFGGLWLWRRWPMGYALAGVLLPKIFATLLTLIISTVASVEWGLPANPLETLMYVAALAGAAGLVVRYLGCVERFEIWDKDNLLDQFIADADVAESQEIVVNAPPDITFDVARNLDLMSIPLIRAIFRLRELVFRLKPAPRLNPRGIVEETLAMGWRRLAERPGRELVMGAVTQPWVGDVKFRGLSPDEFASFDEPNFVKIAWTLEVEPCTGDVTRFRTQTRVLATDRWSRMRFRFYWLFAGPFILMIRRLGNRVIRREAQMRAGMSIRVEKQERRRTLPGDELITKPIASLTHAITIRRPPRKVWPWLVQMGAGRAGWYSYDFIDNGGAKSAEEIKPELQPIQIGETFPALPGVTDGFKVVAFEPERFLILGWQAPDGRFLSTWTFVLEKTPGDWTRLIVRARGGSGYHFYGLSWRLAKFLLIPGHSVMERRQLKGIARRVETASVAI